MGLEDYGGPLEENREGRGSTDVELEYFKRYLHLVWSLCTVLKSLPATSIQPILMELLHPTL